MRIESNQSGRQACRMVICLATPNSGTVIDSIPHMGNVIWKDLPQNYQVPRRDHFLKAMSYLTFDGIYDIPSMIGTSSIPLGYSGTTSHEVPIGRIDTWKASSKDDFRYPSNPWAALATPVVADYTDDRYRRDNNVDHVSMRGRASVFDGPRSFRMPMKVTSAFGIEYDGYSKWMSLFQNGEPVDWPAESATSATGFRVGAGFHQLMFSSADLSTVASYDDIITQPRYGSLDSFVENHTGVEVMYHEDLDGYSVDTFISDVQYEMYQAGRRISYTLRQVYLQSGLPAQYGLWRVVVSSDPIPWRTTNAIAPPFRYWHDGTYSRTSYSCTLLEGVTYYNSGGIQKVTQPSYTATYNFSNPNELGWSQNCGPFYTSAFARRYAVGDILVGVLNNTSLAYGDLCRHELPELRRSGTYAFLNSLASDLEILDNNYVEVISELSGITELLPDVKAITHTFYRGPKKAIIDGAIGLGTWLAGEYLRYSFGLAPTVGVISELNMIGPRFVSLLSDLKVNRRILRGSFTFDGLPDDLIHGERMLTTRSFSEVEYPSSVFWFVISKLYGLGLAPGFQNVWEVRPFTFAVDWFSNMSARFKYIDLTIMSAFISIKSLQYTFDVSCKPSLDYLRSQLAMAGVTGDSLQLSSAILRYYRRELTLTGPTLSDGSIDFLQAKNNPPLDILGSLIITLSK